MVSPMPDKTVKMDKGSINPKLDKLISSLDNFDNINKKMGTIVGSQEISGEAADALSESLLVLVSYGEQYSLVIRNLKEVIVDYCRSVEEIDKTAANAVSKGV
ncbi:hypothetical protein HXJ85_11095 [Listeria monocytogenes]|uniref:Uncharacterized protein n=3 Tax=Listeria monocytogenes TaxID=1639 RepID=A0A9P2DU21_LISMN|nr:hypothetical protein [Listeria monocytogenes]EAA0165346.1 hypothetical protein [Listeria monocytogenes serotype 1/2a]EAD3235676.1 hypothetical protein [Listeria monocytogenes CFSAN002202]EAE6021347.1 hypothetical protein [Listeria monocytogenes serotype 3a]EAF4520985.1 hypothetical protein [Listeria monocytogenes serotype 4b]EAG6284387.1 hypothetical protein [Listeria monocytogenes CFSAN003810]EAG9423967.1 hypothetical protein [Listeria monocytogenes CFSAN002184]EAG9458517.1 hypothetical 